MKLVPFPNQYLRAGCPLPFGVHDGTGRLLLGGGTKIEGDAQLSTLQAQPLFVDEGAMAEWRRRVQVAMDQQIRQGAVLAKVAEAQPEATDNNARPVRERLLPEQWDMLVSQLDSALRDVRPDSDWRARVLDVHERSRQLLARRPDASLYHLVHSAAHSAEKYSSNHAVLTSVICELAAPLLDWPADWRKSVTLAALTMDVAVLRLQDQQAASQLPLSAAAQAEIAAHARTGAQLLSDCALHDATAVEVVRRHDEPDKAGVALSSLPAAQQMARLLRRAEVFAAKIRRRAASLPTTPMSATRDACLGADGKPDEIGGALVKAVGLYPPGSFVELVSGELGIVLARGRRADLPVVATLKSASGEALLEPMVRDTVERRHAVKCGLPPERVKVHPPHERLMALR